MTWWQIDDQPSDLALAHRGQLGGDDLEVPVYQRPVRLGGGDGLAEAHPISAEFSSEPSRHEEWAGGAASGERYWDPLCDFPRLLAALIRTGLSKDYESVLGRAAGERSAAN